MPTTKGMSRINSKWGPKSKTQPFVQLEQKKRTARGVSICLTQLENLPLLSNSFDMISRASPSLRWASPSLDEFNPRPEGVTKGFLPAVGDDVGTDDAELGGTTTPAEAMPFAVIS